MSDSYNETDFDNINLDLRKSFERLNEMIKTVNSSDLTEYSKSIEDISKKLLIKVLKDIVDNESEVSQSSEIKHY